MPDQISLEDEGEPANEGTRESVVPLGIAAAICCGICLFTLLPPASGITLSPAQLAVLILMRIHLGVLGLPLLTMLWRGRFRAREDCCPLHWLTLAICATAGVMLMWILAGHHADLTLRLAGGLATMATYSLAMVYLPLSWASQREPWDTPLPAHCHSYTSWVLHLAICYHPLSLLWLLTTQLPPSLWSP